MNFLDKENVDIIDFWISDIIDYGYYVLQRRKLVERSFFRIDEASIIF